MNFKKSFFKILTAVITAVIISFIRCHFVFAADIVVSDYYNDRFMYYIQSVLQTQIVNNNFTGSYPRNNNVKTWVIDASTLSDSNYLYFNVPDDYVSSNGQFAQFYFLWSSNDLMVNDYWNYSFGSSSDAYKQFSLPQSTDYRINELSPELTYDCWSSKVNYIVLKSSGVYMFKPTFPKDYGYYYISMASYNQSKYNLTDFDLFICGFPEPTPTPSPTPTPDVPTPTPGQDPGDVGGASSQLGTFGSDDGTGNWVYSSFMKLYNSLNGIMSDTSTPDLNLPDSAFADLSGSNDVVNNIQNYSSPSALINSMQIDSFVNVAQVMNDFVMVLASRPTSQVMVFDNKSVPLGEQVAISQTYDVDPYFIEISETDMVSGELRSGNSYVLRYKKLIPVRFYYDNHTGVARSSEDLRFNVSFSYDVPQISGNPVGSYSWGEPIMYIEGGDDISYNMNQQFSESNGTLNGDFYVRFIDIPVVDDLSYTYNIVLEWNVYVSAVGSPTVFPSASNYQSHFDLNWSMYIRNLGFYHKSDSTVDGTLQDIYNEQVSQNQKEDERYQEEQEKTQEAIDSTNEGLGQVTDTLTSWEIFILPFTILKDFIAAIASDGATTLTFPSFQLMGETLWPSYTFDLVTIEQQFPLLVNSLHLISGIFVVIWFLRYLWRKWHLITGDDLPEGEDE